MLKTGDISSHRQAVSLHVQWSTWQSSGALSQERKEKIIKKQRRARQDENVLERCDAISDGRFRPSPETQMSAAIFSI